MALIVVLLCLLVQRVFAFEMHKPQLDWFIHYYNRLEGLCNKAQWWQGIGGVLVLVGSLAVIYWVMISLLSHVLGLIFVFLFHVCVLWYYMDATPLSEETAKQTALTALFMNRYQSIFAVLFWYIVLGPFGVILYAEARKLEVYLKAQQEVDVYFAADFLQQLIWFRSLMDWVPVRLLGLTYALVGQFRPAFQYWRSRLAGLEVDPILVVDYGMIALNWDPNVALSSTLEQVTEIRSLVTRALILWLSVLAIFTLGRFI